MKRSVQLVDLSRPWGSCLPGLGRSMAGQPQCDLAKNAGAAPGQKYGISADVAAKKQADAQKYETAGANSATEACEKQSAPGSSTSSNRKN